MDEDPNSGFKKLSFLLNNPPFPPETFGNILLLYVKYGYFDLAADVMAEHSLLTYNLLSRDMYEFLDASIMSQTSPAEAFRKFDELSKRHVDSLRKVCQT